MIYENGIYREMTPEEITAREHDSNIFAAEEANRPLTDSEVFRLLLTRQINTLGVDDNTALRMKEFYPTFESLLGQTVEMGFKFTYGGKLWRVIQPSLIIQSHYAPGAWTESLYAQVNSNHAGTPEDPVAYDGNMTLEAGKYYWQNGIYRCIRSTENPVFAPLADLAGIYVEAY